MTALAALVGAAGCVPETPTAAARAKFEVVGLPIDGLDRVPRNQEIQLVLSQPVETTSVNSETIRLLSGPDYLQPVPARFDVKGRSVTIRGDSDMPTGLRPSTEYQVLVPGFPRFHTVRAVSGQGVAEPFRGSFRTSSELAPDFELPTLLTDTAPQPIHSLGEITIEFSEAMDPRSLASDHLVVRNEYGERIQGRFTPNPSLKKVTFVPESARYPGSVFHVTVRPEVADLAGNPLHGTFVLTYLLDRDRELASPTIELSDPAATRRGAAIEVTARGVTPRFDPIGDLERRIFEAERVAVEPAAAGVWNEGEARRVQLLFTPEEVGGAGEIHRLYFETLARPDRPTFFNHTEIRLWPTDRDELSPVFHENYPRDPEDAVLHHLPYLEVPERGVFPFFTVALRQPFFYDGEHNLVVEIVQFGGTGEVIAAGTETPSRITRVSGSPYDLEGQTDRVIDDIRFGRIRPDRWVEQVAFVDRGDLEAGRIVLEGSVPYLQDFILVEYEGTEQVGFDASAAAPPTGFERRPGRLSGHRYIRCRIHFLRDWVDGQNVEVERIRFPR